MDTLSTSLFLCLSLISKSTFQLKSKKFIKHTFLLRDAEVAIRGLL